MIQRDDRQVPERLRSLEDGELARRAQDGSLDAFTALYHRYLPKVYNRVRYRVPDIDVEDVTQEIFISMLKSLPSFDGRSKFSTWLWTLTSRRIADYYRRQNDDRVQLDADVSEAEPGISESLQVDSNAAVAETRVIVQRGLNALPDHYREVLLLRFADGLKFREIATYRGQSLAATKSLFRRAVDHLREHMREASDA